MNKSLKYKLDTPEIIAFVIGVLLIMALNRFLFSLPIFASQEIRMVLVVSVIAIVATMFGSISGGLTGFLGALCAMAVCGNEMNFSIAISFAVYGGFLGQFADKYSAREGALSIRQMLLWVFTNASALIAGLIIVKPLLEYVFYDGNLIADIIEGTKYMIICAGPLGLTLVVVFFLLGKILVFVKK